MIPSVILRLHGTQASVTWRSVAGVEDVNRAVIDGCHRRSLNSSCGGSNFALWYDVTKH